MEHAHMVKLSKRMSKALRHDPGRIGLTLEPGGWVPVADLVAALGVDRADVDTVVANNDKKRFSIVLGPDGVERIRASQGHSVPVDLGLVPVDPPERLYHGTNAAAVPSIRDTGLNRGGRHDVHLSTDEATARRVGARRGGPVVILEVDAGAMARAGYEFYRSDNGVWLTAEVPAQYIN
jgi:putative RNA 2'-phosphotransferase